MRSSYVVVIAGAGPTGLTLANLLGKAGIRTLLAETNASTVGEPRAVSIDDESLRVVQAMGLIDAVSKDIVRGYGSEYRSPAGSTFLKVHPLAEPYGHPRRNAFRQPLLEAQLREGLSRYPTVDTRFLCPMIGFEQHAEGVTVQLQPVDGPAVTVQADYLIGCDGARSSVRQQLGIALAGSSLHERWLIIDLANSPAPSPETIVFCDATRPCIALPGPHRTRRYEFKLLPGESEAQMLSDESVSRLLGSHGAAPGSAIVRKTVYHFHARIAERWGQERVWLAGDAAHLMPPFAGQGMNSGIRDASNLAWKLAEIVRGRIGPGLLVTYEHERRRHVQRMIQLALRMGAVMGPRTRAHGWATRLFFRALGVSPAVRSYFAEMRYKPPPCFDGGFIARSMLSRNGVVGRMLPQPRIRVGAHAGQRLDDVLGEGFVLLGIGVDPDTLAALPLGGHAGMLVDRRLSLPVEAVPELGAHSGQLLWLRPDRYVMARCRPAEWPAAVSEIEQLWMQAHPFPQVLNASTA